jgi:signal transduction histidine kinase
VLTAFLCHGLELGEKVLYIVDIHTAQVILGYLQDHGLDADSYLTSGQLSILSVKDVYIKNGVFDPDEVITLLRAEKERAVADGFPALRVTGEMGWALQGLPGSERLIEYEAKLNQFFPSSKCLAICQYERRRFGPGLLLDVLTTHPVAIIGTQVYENFYYIPPAEFLDSDLPAAKLGRWVDNLAERKRAEVKLLTYQGQLRSLASQLSLTEERERRRVARELHDSIGHALALCKIKLGALQESLSSTGHAGHLDEIFELIEQAIQSARSLTSELSPPVLHELGFEPAVEWLAERIQQQYGIAIDFKNDRQPKPLDDDVQILLFQVTRELLVNVMKHAQAQNARVSIHRDCDNIRLSVEDDGAGFDTSKIVSEPISTGRLGFFNIRERLNHIQGDLEIQSELGHGSRITIVVPLKLKSEITNGRLT